MESKLNVTYIILGGYVEVNKYRYLYFVIMFTAYVLILCSNCTIVCLIVTHKNLHEPMYVFIAALLINSVLSSTLIYPKLLIDVLSEKQVISYSACLFQWSAYYCLAGSEFFLLAVMSYDRYVAICKPLHYPTTMRRINVKIALILAWFLPVCHTTVPPIIMVKKKPCSFSFNGIICNSMIHKLQCVRSVAMNIFGLIAFANISIFPLLFIFFTYSRILVVVYQSSREVRRKAAQTCLPHFIVLINFFCLFTYDVLLLRLETDFPTTTRFILTLQMILYHPLFNPIIYGFKMKEINKNLKRLFGKMFQ